MQNQVGKWNWGEIAFRVIMEAYGNPQLSKYIDQSREKDVSETFRFSLFLNGEERVFYIYRCHSKWFFGLFAGKNAFDVLIENKVPVCII